MIALLLTTVHGIIALNKENKVVGITFQDLSLKELAQNYILMQKGEIPLKFKQFIELMKEKGYDSFEFENPKSKILFKDINDVSFAVSEDFQRMKQLRENLVQLLVDSKISFSAKQLYERSKILSEIMIKEQFAESVTQKDFQIKQGVDLIVDMDKSINLLTTRLREWYGLHFPELTDKLIADHVIFTKLVFELGVKENFTADAIRSIVELKDQKVELIVAKSQRSLGGNFSQIDITTIQNLAKIILDQVEYRKNLENYISEALDSIAPNLKHVLGAAITSKLISIAGSLERLAKLSSSTIQILGAEKALFKALKSGGKTPKYGILFQWNKIRGEKSYLRGKIARMVAGKVSILAKVDYYKGEFIGDKMKETINKKIERIQTQFPKPPREKKPIPPKYQKKSTQSSQRYKKRDQQKKYDPRNKSTQHYKKRDQRSKFDQRKRR